MEKTIHRIYFGNSAHMNIVQNASIDLIVTSPPYPMIEMWDEVMSNLNPEISKIMTDDPSQAFELMHKELDKTWKECFRVLKEGGFLCINIGDATRTINGEFRIYNNHARIVQYCTSLGFNNLPNIIWRKPTNSPNKFMGSGMLPCGAYVTLEHEYILIFRKGGKRKYSTEPEKNLRQGSAFFWEERNQWFSDLWELKGAKQQMHHSSTRKRNASFPVAIPYRLISMYSQRGDTVLDPFYGLGTTTIAAMASGRNSIGFDIDKALLPNIRATIEGTTIDEMNAIIYSRYKNHLNFIANRKAEDKPVKYHNAFLNTDVMTRQEQMLTLQYVKEVECTDGIGQTYVCSYIDNSRLDEIAPMSSGLFG